MNHDALVPESLTIRASDDVALSATLFVPPAGVRKRGAALIAGAMGVSQRFYRAFAEWLARQGFVAMTFDYRGMGESRRGSLRDERADIETWAREDAGAALRAIVQRAEGLPLTWIGHSLGGQIIGMVPGHERIARALTIATGSGYWRENAAPLRKRVWIFWWGAVPVATPLFGYFPGKRLGMVGDLPKGVIYQWRKWCLDPQYAVGAEGERVRAQFASVRAPIVALSFDDDEMMSEQNTRSIHAMYTSAPVRHVRVQSLHERSLRIGHFGFFRKELGETLWGALAREHLAEELDDTRAALGA